jgi:hypothetical protein
MREMRKSRHRNEGFLNTKGEKEEVGVNDRCETLWNTRKGEEMERGGERERERELTKFQPQLKSTV